MSSTSIGEESGDELTLPPKLSSNGSTQTPKAHVEKHKHSNGKRKVMTGTFDSDNRKQPNKIKKAKRNADKEGKYKLSPRNKKKKKQGMDVEHVKAADISLHALRRLRSIVFHTECKLSNSVPTGKKERAVAKERQFEDAQEPLEQSSKLNQFHSADMGGNTRPPFGYFSIHPASLFLHHPSAVQHFYPAGMQMAALQGNMPQPANYQFLRHDDQSSHKLPQQGFVHPPPPPSLLSAASSQMGAAAMMSSPGVKAQSNNMVTPNIMHPSMLQSMQMSKHHQHLSGQNVQASPGATHQPMANAQGPLPPMIAGVNQQQQLPLQYQQQLHRQGPQQSFPDYAAAFVKRQQQQQQQQQQQKQYPGQQPQYPQLYPHPFPPAYPYPPHSQPKQAAPKKQNDTEKKEQDLERALMLKKALANVQGVPRNPRGTHPDVEASAAMLALAGVGKHKQKSSEPQINYVDNEHSKQESVRKSGGKKQEFSTAIMDKARKPKSAGAADKEDQEIDNADAKNLIPSLRQYMEPPGLKAIIEMKGPPKLLEGIDELENLPMLKKTLPDNDRKNPVKEKEFRACDVLLGRGGLTNHHAGNEHFRSLVAKFRLHYHLAKKGDKGKLSKKLANFVRHKGGRFLQKNEDDGQWYECGDQRAWAKAAQALREGTTSAEQMSSQEGSIEMDEHSEGNSTLKGTAAAAAFSTAYSKEPYYHYHGRPHALAPLLPFASSAAPTDFIQQPAKQPRVPLAPAEEEQEEESEEESEDDEADFI